MDVEGARAAAEAAVHAKARFVRRWGSLSALLVVVGIIVVFAAPDAEVAQLVTFLPGFVGLGSLGFYSLPFVAVGRRLLDHPAGDGRVQVRPVTRSTVLDVWPPGASPGGAPLSGRQVQSRLRAWPKGEVPAVLFGDPSAGGAVLAVVDGTDGQPLVVATPRLRAP